MQYEVEQKFPVADLAAVEADLAALGAKIAAAEEEVDLYFAHPARDFAATDEALRLRRKGPRGYITYKGPKIDAVTKTRREIELPLVEAAGGPAEWREPAGGAGISPRGRGPQVAPQGPGLLARPPGRGLVGRGRGAGDVRRVGIDGRLRGGGGGQGLDCRPGRPTGLSGSERRSYLELLLQRRENER